MKTVQLSVSETDIAEIKAIQAKYVKKTTDYYNEHPTHFIRRPFDELAKVWHYNGGLEGVFSVIKNDGLATISKERDAYYSFADHAGDCFDPTVNTDIAPEELKRQEKRELARFNRQGVWYHTLSVEGKEIDDCSIGGFVGNDLYGSGYDLDFYRAAIDELRSKHSDYIATLLYVAEISQ